MTLLELYGVLTKRFNFCHFNLKDDQIQYQVLNGIFKNISKIEGTRTIIISYETFKLYFNNTDELFDYINKEFIETMYQLNSMCEQQFAHTAKSFDFSDKVADPTSVLFSNIIVLEHIHNNFLKGWFGKNRYFTVLLTLLRDGDAFHHCIGVYEEGKDALLVSTTKRYELFGWTAEMLKSKFNFELKPRKDWNGRTI